eukprot:14029-Heterococcus_DN1.PRE.3
MHDEEQSTQLAVLTQYEHNATCRMTTRCSIAAHVMTQWCMLRLYYYKLDASALSGKYTTTSSVVNCNQC